MREFILRNVTTQFFTSELNKIGQFVEPFINTFCAYKKSKIYTIQQFINKGKSHSYLKMIMYSDESFQDNFFINDQIADEKDEEKNENLSKQKPIRKQKKPAPRDNKPKGKVQVKKNSKLEVDPNDPSKTRSSDIVFDSPEQEFSNIESNLIVKNRPQKKGRKVKRNKKPNVESSDFSESQNMEDQQDEQNDDEIEDLRMIWIQLFNQTEQPHGLVFKKEFRTKLKKLFPNIQFTDEHDLDPEGEEIGKIIKEVYKLWIFKKKNHSIEMTDMDFGQYIKNDVEKMIEVFKQSSYIFCKQVTEELYRIEGNFCNIAAEFRNKQKPSEKNSEMIQRLRQFGNKLASQDDPGCKYFFFGFQFMKFPKETSEEDQMALKKNGDKYRYALLSKYRKPETQFANFAEKAGLHLLEQIKKLECFGTLI